MSKKKELTLEEQEAKSKRIGKRRKHEYTKEEEKELIRQAQKGNKQAVRDLVFVNDKYLNSFVRKRKNETDLPEEDLKQEAILGLIDAILKYNTDKFDVKLVTYAYYPISRALNDAVQKSKQLKISQYGFSRYRKINQIIAESAKKKGIIPSIQDISEQLNISSEAVDYILSINNVSSLDSYKKDADDDFSTFQLDQEEYGIEKEIKVAEDDYKDLYCILDGLSDIKKNIICDYYGINTVKLKSFEIRKKYNISKEILDKLLQETYEEIKASFN